MFPTYWSRETNRRHFSKPQQGNIHHHLALFIIRLLDHICFQQELTSPSNIFTMFYFCLVFLVTTTFASELIPPCISLPPLSKSAWPPQNNHSIVALPTLTSSSLFFCSSIQPALFLTVLLLLCITNNRLSTRRRHRLSTCLSHRPMRRRSKKKRDNQPNQ